jgi:hypothetical protein
MSSHLENVFKAVLIQDIDTLERLNPLICPVPCTLGMGCCPCEEANTYHLLHIDEEDEEFQNPGHELFEFKEKSNFLTRTVFAPSYRALEIEGKNRYNDLLITAEKPFKCSVLCMARPEMQVKYKNQYIGKVVDPFSFQSCRCLFQEINIHDKNGAVSFKVRATFFQAGIFCFLPFNYCREIRYNIINKKDEIVGTIKHIFRNCQVEYCTKADKFTIDFPKFATIEEKILIVVAALFMDYQWFENC